MSKPALLERLSILARSEREIREQKPGAIEAAVTAGCTWIEIAAALGCSRQALYGYRRRRRQEA